MLLILLGFGKNYIVCHLVEAMYGQTDKFKDCFLAYLDILGFKDKVKEGKGQRWREICIAD